jgi:hypothetical protein
MPERRSAERRKPAPATQGPAPEEETSDRPRRARGRPGSLLMGPGHLVPWSGPDRRRGGDRREEERRDEQERRSGDRRTGMDRRGGHSGIAHMAASVASSVADLAESAAGPIASVARPVVHGVDRGVGEAVRRWRSTDAARANALRARAKEPLPSLWELHPEARRASPRELGLLTIPLDEIRGTAVEGSVQRGGDFLPLPKLRGSNWLGRWQRLRRAVEQLEILPPIDVIRYADGYWVVDGHNRVAAALYAGQAAIDAAVVELRMHGARRAGRVAPLAPLLAEGRDLRAVGSGRLSRTASPRSLPPSRQARDGVVQSTTEKRSDGEDRRS